MPDDDAPDPGGTDPPGETESPDPPSITCCPTCKCKPSKSRKPRQPRKPRPPKLTFVPPPPPASLDDIIREAIAGPKSVTVDGQNVTAHDLRQLIDLDRYLASKKAATGIRFTKMVPPGAG